MTADTPPTMQEVADLLRSAVFAMDRAETALIAFSDRRFVDAVGRDCGRLREVRKRINETLEHLPPAEPLTPEREAKLGAFLGAVLNKRFGDGTDEDVKAALDGLVDDDR